jgi:hypothetical protein
MRSVAAVIAETANCGFHRGPVDPAGGSFTRSDSHSPEIRMIEMEDAATEMKSLAIRASIEEARRQAAARRGDRQAAQEHETELSRIWSRYCDLERRDD